jgi:hypothetical protein
MLALLLLLPGPGLPSHLYAALQDIWAESGDSARPTDPALLFRDIKALVQEGRAEPHDLLGAAAGLGRVARALGEPGLGLGEEDSRLVGAVTAYLGEEGEPACLAPARPSRLTCTVEPARGFLRRELLHAGEPEVVMLHHVFSPAELAGILRTARARRLLHMYSLYSDWLEAVPAAPAPPGAGLGWNFTQADWSLLAHSHSLGREGKLYFPEADWPEARAIEGRLRAVLGAATGGRAALQLSTYGPGGWLSPHYDTYRRPGEPAEGEERGEKWAGTVLGFLTPVAAGGHTVFPRLGLRVEPVPGSILLWPTVGRAGQVRH